MIKLKFSEKQKMELFKYRYSYPHPRVQEKMEALYLKSMNVPHSEICRLCRISRVSLAKYLKEYRDYGIDGLKRWGYAGQSTRLRQFSGNIEQMFKHTPPVNSKQAQEMIEQETGIRRSPTQIREFMKSIGMRFRKIGSFPKGAETEIKQQEQQDFIKKNSCRNYGKQRKKSGWHFS